MNEQTNTLKHRFNIMDFFIIVLVAVSVAAILLRSGVTDIIDGGQKEVTVRYSFIIEGIRETSEGYLTPGTDLIIQSDLTSAGKIVESEVTPAVSYIELNDGSIRKTQIPERIDVRGVAELKVKKSEAGEYFMPNTMFLSAGRQLYCQTESVVVMLTVISVKEVG